MFGSRIVLEQDDSCTDYDCRMGGHAGLVAFTRAIVRGDSAEIDLHYRGRSSVANPRAALKRIDRWVFVKSGEGWKMVSRKNLIIM